jgi:hypothetical protein
MAYMVYRPSGTWEVRESRATPAGPRSRTLATFRTLTPEIVARVRARSAKQLSADELRRAASRAGAPIAPSPSDRAAGELLAEVGAGRQPRPALRRLLLAALQDRPDASLDSARSAASWITATAAQRGEALRDLLLLTDSLPPRRAASPLRFPPVASKPL